MPNYDNLFEFIEYVRKIITKFPNNHGQILLPKGKKRHCPLHQKQCTTNLKDQLQGV